MKWLENNNNIIKSNVASTRDMNKGLKRILKDKNFNK